MKDARSIRAKEIQDSIRNVLFNDWDPIGVNENLNLRGEYDSYIGRVYRILATSRSEKELIQYLTKTENETIGMTTEDPEQLRKVAQALLRINVSL